MATLSEDKIKARKKKRRKTFLIVATIQLLLAPLVVYLLHQILTMLGNQKLELAALNYSYLTSIQLLFENSRIQILFLGVELTFIALWIYASITVEPVVAKVDTVFLTDDIEVPVPAGNGQHGKERFLTEAEKKKLYKEFVFTGTETLNGKGGIVVDYKKEVKSSGKTIEKIYYIAKDFHTLIIGASRSGKTRRVLLSTIFLQIISGISAFNSDVKGEVYYATSPLARLFGFVTLAFDLRNPKKSVHYNFLQPILDALEEEDTSKAIDYTWDLVSVLVGQPKGEPLWTNGESATIAAAILIVCIDAPKKYRNLTNVYYFIAQMCEAGDMGIIPLSQYLDNLDDTHPAKGVFAMATIAPHKTRSSFFTSALGTLKLFTNPNVAEMTSKSDFKLKDISTKKTMFYAIIPDEKKTMYPLVSILVTQLYTMQVELATENGLRLPVDTDYNLDEVGNFPYIPVLGNMLSAGASRGVRCNLIIQDYQQLESKYKEEWRNIVTNCQNKIYLKSDDPQTLKQISEGLGKYTVEVSSASTNVAEGKKNNASFSSSANLTGRELLFPSEIGRIKSPYALCMLQGEYPAINNLPDLSEYKINELYGLGDEEFNKKLFMEREKERPENPIPELQLWGIWKKYKVQEETVEPQERVSFLNFN